MKRKKNIKRSWHIREGQTIFSLNDQEGYALPLVLAVMAMLIGGGLVLLSAVAFSVRDSENALAYQKAILSGKNAIEFCRAKLTEDSEYPGTNGKISLEDGAWWTIKVQKISESKRFIVIKTEYGDFGRHYEGEAEIDSATGTILTWQLNLKGW